MRAPRIAGLDRSMQIPIVERAHGHTERTAIVAAEGRFTYRQLLDASARLAARLMDGAADLSEARVAFMMPSSFAYVVTQWAIWRAGGIAVPLCTRHPAPELAYVLDDAQASIVVTHPEFQSLLEPLARQRKLRFLNIRGNGPGPQRPLPQVAPSRRAMILYTSGTTGKPKGVVTSHQNIVAQISSLTEAWRWHADDRVLLVLPLHHIHGIINVLGCALWAGAACEMMGRFEAGAAWEQIMAGELTLFMAVPTIYSRLIATWENAEADQRKAMLEGCRKLRLMVSGSAALPVSTLQQWRQISGHTLLERYGMTEIGMALSNPLEGERRGGYVGSPLPGVEVRLVDEKGVPIADQTPGEIQVRGGNVFLEYWKRPRATQEAFQDGYFKTGDVAIRVKNAYRILGRSSVDIIKTGGEKVSALEVEEVLRTHEAIEECAVVGLPDKVWGQRVCAAVVLKKGGQLDRRGLRSWGKQRLADYKVPRNLLVVDQLPRNAMGKVTKPQVAQLFQRKRPQPSAKQ